MRICIATKDDIKNINKLLKDNLEQSTYEDYPQEMLDSYLEENGKYILIGDEFVRFVGFIFFSEQKDEGYISIDEVVIDKKFKNRGYEERLLYYILEYAKGWGITNFKVNSKINNLNIENVVINYGFNCEKELSDEFRLKKMKSE